MDTALSDRRGRTANSLVEGARPDYDCIVGNIAALLAADEIDPDRILGGVLVTSPQHGGDFAPNFDWIGDKQIGAARASGLTARETATYVAIGDGFDMPWSPYHRTHHVEHGFLVVDESFGFDAYDTVTEFGEARPQILDDDQWRSVPMRRRLHVDTSGIDSSTRAKPTVVHYEQAIRDYREAVESGTASIEQLSVDTWSLARARRVNLRYAADDVTDLLRASVDAWTAASEAVYMALRRFRRGRPVPNSYVRAVTAALDADRPVVGVWTQ